MKFAVARISFWQSVGFDTEHWRTSTDGTKALVHTKFAEALVPNLNEHPEVQIFDVDSIEFQTMLINEFTLETREII